ncbi:beta-glucosidase [Sphingomonas faeni]|uniref:beta-glucosidase n=1 Tax=Sphingomonas faeni TaxID=185950 RepID=UPI0020C774C3|nr:glycoside hydrolase family 3 protein [Sphingomonas faeni]MCP8892075.1 beta-glucosidase [Sphingomonas faeni]
MIRSLLWGSASLALVIPMLSAAQTGVSDPDARAARAEARMTDDERVGLLIGIMPIPIPGLPVDIPPGVPVTAGYIAGVPRLGVPAQLSSDASLGVTNPAQLRKGDTSTALPSGLAVAATFDPTLAERAGAMVGAEARAKGFNILLGGGANLTRDPRNGRNFEYLGEDPLLTGRMVGQAIRGTQAQGVVSTIKHFAINGQETQRHTANSTIDPDALRESDLLAFELGIETGRPGAVMCAYNLVNGAEACGNAPLLNGVLKGDWGYKGWVMSDWGAVESTDFLEKGLDQQSGSQLDKQRWFDAPLKRGLADGTIPRARVSDAVRRILRSVYAVGADKPTRPAPIDVAGHAQVALKTAQDGIVLLKNDGILPLAKTARTILVVGGQASFGVLSGGGSSQVTPNGAAPRIIDLGGAGLGGLLSRQIYFPSSPVDALKVAMPQATLTFSSGYSIANTAAMAKAADMVIVFATKWEGEDVDSASLELPQGQDALIAAMAGANRNTVVVLETGNPVAMPWLNDVRAVVEAWYPGQEGGRAIADVLTGRINPSGRLPITFPRSLADDPRPTLPGLGQPDRTAVDVPYSEGSAVGYRRLGRARDAVLFPFGHGLSYTRFGYSALTASGGDTVTLRMTIRNDGDRPGADVPQAYLVRRGGQAIRRLVGFEKVMLQPGESRTVTMAVDPRLLADFRDGQWRVPAGRYAFAIGKSATDLGNPAEVTVRARQVRP